MAYLRRQDYFSTIRERDFNELIEEASQTLSYTPNKVVSEVELNTQSIVETEIRHRYDVAEIFKDVLTWNSSDTFNIGDLVSYSETAYDNTSTYAVDDLVSYSQKVDEDAHQVLADDIFKCTTTVSAAEDFDYAKWTKVTENNSLYYCEQPSTNNKPGTDFSYTTNAYTGNHDLIEGWDKTKSLFFIRDNYQVRIYYTAADRTNNANSIGVVDFSPVAKKFPDNRPITRGTDLDNSLSGTLTFTGFIPDDTEWSVVPSNYWIKGDNRDRTIKWILVQLCIAELHKLISPRNVPQHRLEAKDDAMNLLKKVSKGDITADLPLHFDEERGASVVWGSKKKRSFSGY